MPIVWTKTEFRTPTRTESYTGECDNGRVTLLLWREGPGLCWTGRVFFDAIGTGAFPFSNSDLELCKVFIRAEAQRLLQADIDKTKKLMESF
jgi:hypothetical protein